MTPSRPREFIASLQKLAAAADRGALADLRHGVADAVACRAWPHIAPFCDLRNQEELPAFVVVGAGFAMHGQTSPQAGNLGSTLRRIAVEGREGNRSEALNSFAGRFRRLLTCNSVAEVCGRLPAVLRAAARQGLAVNYQMLLDDLLKWRDQTHRDEVKLRWAAAYWGASPEEYEKGGEDQ